jgi:hypothetical protein
MVFRGLVVELEGTPVFSRMAEDMTVADMKRRAIAPPA